jgi:DNA-directed RNA polymerase I, II, and III subunit RPABC2
MSEYEETEDSIVFADVEVEPEESENSAHENDSSDSENDSENDTDDEVKEIVVLESEPVLLDQSRMIPNEERTTMPVLSKYERAKIIGLRARLLDEGAKPLVSVPTGLTDVIKIAQLELRAKKCPVIVYRTFLNGSYEAWKITDFMVVE